MDIYELFATEAKEFLPPQIRPKLASIYRYIKYRQRPKLSSMKSSPEEALRCCIAYNKYGAYCIPLASTHTTVSQAILSGEVYESDTLNFMRDLARKGDVIHAGAYIGDFLPGLAGPFKIWAFEPHTENFRCAQITIQLNSLHGIELSQFGLGGRNEEVNLLVQNQDGPTGATAKVVGSTQGTQRISVRTLDSIIPPERKISAIHLDIEGYEEQALFGALEIIKRDNPILILETLPSDQWLAENLPEYQVVKRLNWNYVLSSVDLR